jgi:hypothetical protein
MKQQIDTIPVNDAFSTNDECPFCNLQRQAEQRTIRYVLGPGATYMEPDVRAVTDEMGFCPGHTKKLYDYGYALGNALMMQTYMVGLLRELDKQLENYELPDKKGLFSRKPTSPDTLSTWAASKQDSCFVCSRVQNHMQRYYATFYHLIKDEEFRKKVESCKGFCLPHFGQLMEHTDLLPGNQRQWFADTVPPLMRNNLARVQADLDWFIEKFDYRNASADWKNSKDAVSRSMQKLQGIYVNDPPYKPDQK